VSARSVDIGHRWGGERGEKEGGPARVPARATGARTRPLACVQVQRGLSTFFSATVCVADDHKTGVAIGVDIRGRTRGV